VIFGVAVVFPVVITFGVAGVLAVRHAQAGVFPVVITFGVHVPARGVGTLLVITIAIPCFSLRASRGKNDLKLNNKQY